MTLVDLLYGLLDALPKCCQCNDPATNIQSADGMSDDAHSHGKEFKPKTSVKVKQTDNVVGTWTWQLCDNHEIPKQMYPTKRSYFTYAKYVRQGCKAVSALRKAEEAVEALKVITGPKLVSVFPDGNQSFFDVTTKKSKHANGSD